MILFERKVKDIKNSKNEVIMKSRNSFYSLTSIFLLFIIFCSASLQAQDIQKRLKKRVAVFVFDDKTDHRVRWWSGQNVGEGMSDMLTTSLVKTGNYQVIERAELDKIISEQKLGLSGAVTEQSAAQVGKLLGVELAVIGAVTEFGHSQGQVGGNLKKKAFGIGVKSSKATVGIDVRFVNTTTGEIIMAENVREEESKKGLSLDTKDFSFDNRNKFDESIVGKATRKSIDKIVEMLDKATPNIPWQAKVIKGGAQIYINAGSVSGVNVGDQFVVYRAGEELIDPDTGISLGSTESKIGVIKVTNNTIGNGKASQCIVVSGSGFDRNDIVRIN